MSFLLCERQLVLPSIATTVSLASAGITISTQRRKVSSNSSGEISPNTRASVSWDGMPSLKLHEAPQPVEFHLGQLLGAHTLVDFSAEAPAAWAMIQ